MSVWEKAPPPPSGVCSACGKTFKNLRIHTAKSHQDVRLKRSSVRGKVFDDVKYAGSSLELYDDYRSEHTGLLIYKFPKEHPLYCYSKYCGIGLRFNDTGFLEEAFYIRFKYDIGRWSEWGEVGKISMDRVHIEL